MNVWITGAGRGIGRAIARRFAKAKDRVIVSGRSLEPLELLHAEHPNFITTILCDVTDDESVRRACHEIIGQRGVIDVLVNNAGVTVFKEFEHTTVEEFDAVIRTNLRGAFLCARAVLPLMLERQSGAIVMINSMASREVFKKSSAYAASKAGLKAMADAIRIEVRRRGVRVIDVHPGATLTGMWPEHIRTTRAKEMMEEENVAEVIYQAVTAPANIMVEELYLQPTGGPLE